MYAAIRPNITNIVVATILCSELFAISFTVFSANLHPSEDHMDNLKLLCEKVLQPVRDHFGKVVSVSSGYRSDYYTFRG